MDMETRNDLEKRQKRMLEIGFNVVARIFPQKIIELDRIVHANVPSLREPFTDISSLHSNLFTEEDALRSPRKKRKYTEKDADPDSSQRIGIRGSDSLVPLEAQDLPNPKNTCSSRPIPSAHKILHDIIKKQCADIMQLTDQARIWMILTHPTTARAEDDFLAELHMAQESALNMRTVAGKDHLVRAKLCSKLVKHPTIEDYQIALEEHDEQQLYLARQCLYDIRNIYVVLVEMIKATGMLKTGS